MAAQEHLPEDVVEDVVRAALGDQRECLAEAHRLWRIVDLGGAKEGSEEQAAVVGEQGDSR